MTTGVDNPQVPSAVSELYVPDQLIAGRFPIVTGQSVTVTGGANLARGTVLGQITEGAVAGAPGVPATGSVTFTGSGPAAADTLTLNGTAITFVASGATGNQVNIGATPQATMINLLAFLQASADTQLVKFLYSAAGLVLSLIAATPGTGGNSLTLATTSSAITLSGATLSGGAANTGNGTITAISKGVKAQLGNYTIKFLSATTFNVVTPNGTELPPGAALGAYTDAHLNFTLTAGGTAWVAGDQIIVAVSAGSGKYQPCVANATDGSQTPVAILADQANAAAGDVLAAVYLTGEFNANSLTFDPSWTTASLAAALRPSNIYVRNTVPASPPN